MTEREAATARLRDAISDEWRKGTSLEDFATIAARIAIDKAVVPAVQATHRQQFESYLAAHKQGHPDCKTCLWVDVAVPDPWSAVYAEDSKHD